MKFWPLIVGLSSGPFLLMAGDESSTQRLENAQRGMADGSWPKKPDSRLSPLSGKMKAISEITPRDYGQGKEFQAAKLNHLQKEASLGQRPAWERSEGSRWEKSRWQESREASLATQENGRFQPGVGLGKVDEREFQELERKPGPDWSSRVTSTAQRTDGSLRMYQGRLTRVREQVWRNEESPRDLGPGRQEKFSPDQVEEMLSEPVGEIRGAVKAQSRAASPLAVAGN